MLIEFQINILDPEDRSIDVQQIYKLSCGLTDYKATNSNKLEVLKDAKLFLSDVEEEIKNAKINHSYGLLYMESGGEAFEKVENALIAASKRGVAQILVDGVGSAGFRRSKTRRK